MPIHRIDIVYNEGFEVLMDGAKHNIFNFTKCLFKPEGIAPRSPYMFYESLKLEL